LMRSTAGMRGSNDHTAAADGARHTFTHL
jgi:hypothetical protein